jgi:hypothetical protein
MSRKNILVMLGLGMMLAVSGVARGAAAQLYADASPQHWTPTTQAAAPQAAQLYTGQVESIKIDHCDLEPGTCAGSLVLAQANDQEVTLDIPAGITIARGTERVHLEQLGVGNYVTVQAMSLASQKPGSAQFYTGLAGQDGNIHVGTTMGERRPTLEEASSGDNN